MDLADLNAFLQRHYVLISVILGLLGAQLWRRYRERRERLRDEEAFAQVEQKYEEQKSLANVLGDGADPEGFGGTTDRYRWTQSGTDVEIFVPVAPGTSSKQVQCTFAPRRLRLVVDSASILDGEPFANIDPDECIWQLEDDDDGGGDSPITDLTRAAATEEEGEEGEEPVRSEGGDGAAATTPAVARRRLWITLRKKARGFDFHSLLLGAAEYCRGRSGLEARRARGETERRDNVMSLETM